MPPTKKVRPKRQGADTLEPTGATAEQPAAAEPRRIGKRGTVVIPAA